MDLLVEEGEVAEGRVLAQRAPLRVALPRLKSRSEVRVIWDVLEYILIGYSETETRYKNQLIQPVQIPCLQAWDLPRAHRFELHSPA